MVGSPRTAYRARPESRDRAVAVPAGIPAAVRLVVVVAADAADAAEEQGEEELLADRASRFSSSMRRPASSPRLSSLVTPGAVATARRVGQA